MSTLIDRVVSLFVYAINAVYALLWHDLIILPLPGGAQLGLPLLVILTTPYNLAVYVITACIGGGVIWRHRANIKRLLSHSENKLDFNTLKKKKS